MDLNMKKNERPLIDCDIEDKNKTKSNKNPREDREE